MGCLKLAYSRNEETVLRCVWNREKQSKTHVNLYDYRYRFYDPQICRFNSIDRLASDYPYKSPYDYAENRPVNGIDLDGLEWVDATGKGSGPITDEYAKKNNLQLLPGFKTESQSTADQNQQVLQQAAELYPTNNTGSTGTISAIDPVQRYQDQLSATSPVSYSDGAGMIPSLKAGVEAFGFVEGGVALTKMATKLTSLLSVGEKVAKTSTSVVEEAVVHGNSLKSMKPTWGYKLFSEDGTFLKNGITSKVIPETRYTKAFMQGKYMEAIPFPNRAAAYGWESQQNLILRGPLNFNMH